MPIYFLLGLKNGDMAAIFDFGPHDNTVLVYSSKIVQDRISYHYSHIGSHI